MSTDSPHQRLVLAEARESLNQLTSATVRTQNVIVELERLIRSMEAPQTQTPQQAQQEPQRVLGVATHRLNDDAPAPPQQHPVPRVVLKQTGFRRQAAPQAKQPLTTEQIIVRVIAVLGTIITVIGVGLGITLAIQNGLLGPLGRVILAVLLSVALFIGGLIVERRTSATAGSTALYATSFFVAVVTIIGLANWLAWWTPDQASVVHLVLFIGFAVFARMRRNSMLAVAMGIGAIFYLGYFLFANGSLTMVSLATPSILLLTSLPQNRRVILPGAQHVRMAASALAVVNSLYVIGTRGLDTILWVVAIVVYALLAVFIEARSPQPRTQLLQLTLIPLALLLIGAGFSTGWVGWLIPLTTAAGYVIIQRVDTSNPLHKNLWEQSVAWLCFGALSLLALYVTFADEHVNPEIRHFLVIALFAAGFFAVTWELRSRPSYRNIVWPAWAGVAIFLTNDLLPVLTGSAVRELTSPEILFQALGFALILVVAFLHRESLQGIPSGILMVLGIVALYLYMVVMVTVSTFLFELAGDQAPLGFVVGHAIVSVSWILLAAWVLLSKRFLKNNRSLTVGLVLAIAAALKLVFFDLSSIDGIARAVAFTLSGILLITIATIRVRLSARTREAPVENS
ncbi:DUF2339 domain-containing protein [Corynebacterium lubricantis]|uniref:DUF2339 domain-containing protein n=1 Tax=Corynebacterium lubricantis TaxID=541095 RepID=UPI0014613888|nr:DUF2339 domain-containing protein [Corynebacterium lubricantis]